MLLLLVSSLIGLAALAIATWITNHDFVLDNSAQRLRTTAVLKSAQIAFNLELLQTAAAYVTTRVPLQQALSRYNSGENTTRANWEVAEHDLRATLGQVGPLQQSLVLQASVYSRNASGPSGTVSILNVTGNGANTTGLPWNDLDGTQVFLGDTGSGYPPALYPNLTITYDDGPEDNAPEQSPYVATYNGEAIGLTSTLVLGPLSVNASFSLLSLTMPIINSTADTDVLGWITVVTDARLIKLVQQDQRGLGDTGATLLLGPVNSTNLFPPGTLGSERVGEAEVRYLLPINSSTADRHPLHVTGTENPPFLASDYPAAEIALVENARGINDVGSIMRTRNEAGKQVSVGYSFVPTDVVDWVIIVEQARSEVWEPINHLRNIILACLFGVVGLNIIVSFPLAHWAVLPIIRLRAATEQSIDPPRSNGSSQGSSDLSRTNCDAKSSVSMVLARKEGYVEKFARWRGKRRGGLHIEQREDQRFRIPGKVPQKRHFIYDEMSDLITTFNTMSDELYLQYANLEDRVRQRTAELEQSKKAAEAANESKTLFVANVSHELKTPLNGILGMAAVCMEEEDPKRMKQSLSIIYKSGDLLLRTLTDLLTFSTNQVGHQVLKLEEAQLYLRDVESQVLSLFSEQARDKQVNLQVHFEQPPFVGCAPGEPTELRDYVFWGDIHRILQIVINLTSNALKFTSTNGSVTVIMRALTEVPPRRVSASNKNVAHSAQKQQHSRMASNTTGTANFINPRENAQRQSEAQDRSNSPPPGQDMFIEIEVKDTGQGIAPEQQRSIFEPFVQGDAGLSRKHSGTGLGLSICSQLASLMRGSIQLHSVLGEGSTFTTKLPLRRIAGTASARNSIDRTSIDHGPSKTAAVIEKIPEEPPRPTLSALQPSNQTSEAIDEVTHPAMAQASTVKKVAREVKASKEAQSDFSKVRILVAEDNKVNQEVISRMLKLEKVLDVTIAADGAEALALVKAPPSPETPPFDLIFMDVQMPNMDGLQSTKLIREHGFAQPIVALTAFAEQSNIDECYSSGMDYFLAKPIKRPQLKKVLTQYCSAQPRASISADENQDERANIARESPAS